VQLSSRSDAELVTLARRGWPAAFAVLVQRHAATVRAAVAGRPDPDAAVVATFTRAMPHLRRVDPTAPVEPWLLALAPGRKGRTAAPTAPRPAVDGAELDALWAELAPRWPRGRAPRGRLPAWLRWSMLTVVLMALAVVIPYVTITTGQRTAEAEADGDPLRAALLEPADGAADLPDPDPPAEGPSEGGSSDLDLDDPADDAGADTAPAGEGPDATTEPTDVAPPLGGPTTGEDGPA
jgi:hypothetical protein